MSWEAWVTLAVIGVLVVVFVSEWMAPVVAMGGAVVALYLVGVIDLSEAFSGFSNSAPITVAALYILAGAAEMTGALGWISQRALGSGAPTSERSALTRIAVPAAAASAFVANTPLVALMAPRIQSWARRHGMSPSRFLMPLSFAAVFGGVITILGTSTNLVVNGFLDDLGGEPFGVFTITKAGLPVAAAGVALMVLLAPRLLPTRVAPTEGLASSREFTVEMVVMDNSPLVGQTVGDANLRNLQGVFLVEIERSGRMITPVAPDEVLYGSDRLVFAGNVDRVVDLQRIPGLAMAEEPHFGVAGDTDHRFFEAVIADSGALAGTTLKQAEFRERYRAAVVAIHRADTRLSGKLGDVRLRGGDVLLTVSDPGFRHRVRELPDFVVVAPLEQVAPIRRRGARLVELVTLCMVIAAGTGLVDLTKAALGAAMVLLALRVITPAEARRSINLDIILMIAFSFGIGGAVASSGLAEEAARALVNASEPMGDVGVLSAVVIATLILTEVLSNNAAAAVMLPIALAVSSESGVSFTALAAGILIMASCSFLTPIGYQTNTMVFGMGGYRFTDFTRLGAPLTALTVVMTVVVVPITFPL